MNILEKLKLYRTWIRLRTNLLKWMLKFMVVPKPLLLVGPDASLRLCRSIARHGVSELLLVTDGMLVTLGVIQPLLDELEQQGVSVTLYDGVLPDPTEEIIIAGTQLAMQAHCDGVLAVGGGSSIDAAKLIALAAAGTGQLPEGSAAFMRPGLPLYAVPTTAGTGSEVTLGAVITDSRTHAKRGVGGAGLVPQAAALDPLITRGLPPHITAATGMDALTHAIEAFLGTWRNDEADRHALAAARMIFEHLPRAFADGSDLEAREGMLVGAAYAGFAVNANFVGNVHAIAHQLGARYGIPHGLANAVLLPHILEYSLEHATGRMAELARHAKLAEATMDDRELAKILAQRVVELNRLMDIPDTLEQIEQGDIPGLARAAMQEGASYPAPRFLEIEDCVAILMKVSLPQGYHRTQGEDNEKLAA